MNIDPLILEIALLMCSFAGGLLFGRWALSFSDTYTERAPRVIGDTDYQVMKKQLEFLHEDLKAQIASKDGAYTERNALVCLLSKIFPSCLSVHDLNDKTWDDEWRWIVFIELPTGQCSWHIHNTELDNFVHLPIIPETKWDGHTTAEKYARIKNYSGFRCEEPNEPTI